MQHGRETTVLLASCHWPPRQLPIPLGTELDWAWLLRTARQHHVLALVAETLLALSPRQLTPAVREHLAGYRAAVGLRNTYLARELVGLLEQLERGGIVALPFK